MSVDADHAELLQAFDRDGFVAMRAFFAGQELAELRDNVERFIRDVVPTMPAEQVFLEDKQDRSCDDHHLLA